MATETHATPRNRRSFLRMIALGAGVAALVACGATAAKPSLTEEERAALEALGDEMAADLAAGEVKSLKGARFNPEGGPEKSDHYGTVIFAEFCAMVGGPINGIMKCDGDGGYAIIRDEGGFDVFALRQTIDDNDYIGEGVQVQYRIRENPSLRAKIKWVAFDVYNLR